MVTMPKAQGGLGIKNLHLHNKAMMANLTAKLLSTGTGPCFTWLANWYLQDTIPLHPSTTDSAFWKPIMKLIHVVQQTTRCIPQDGSRTSFWHDNWTGLGRLNDALPILFTYAQDQQCTVKSQKLNGNWDIKLHSPLSHLAEEQLQALMTELLNHQAQAQLQQDTRLMNVTNKTTTTRDYYHLFCDRGMRWIPAKWIWRSAIPHRHKVFLWLAFRRRLNTKDNMANKQWGNDSGCDQCPALESFEHISLHCRQASWVWEKLNIAHTAARTNDLVEFVESTISGKDSKTWPLLLAICFLQLWYARNNRIFNNRSTNRQALFGNINQTLDLWATRSIKLAPELVKWKQKFLLD
uniref:Uncharacterized protein n=1 Tax=Avena sativa TaxID=4498 RepID=A0ACD5XRS3_AVESA